MLLNYLKEFATFLVHVCIFIALLAFFQKTDASSDNRNAEFKESFWTNWCLCLSGVYFKKSVRLNYNTLQNMMLMCIQPGTWE